MRRRKDAIGSSCYYRHFGGSAVLAVLAVVVVSHYGTNRWFGFPMALKVGFGSVRSDSLCSNSIFFFSRPYSQTTKYSSISTVIVERQEKRERERKRNTRK